MASIQDSEDRPIAQTFARMVRANRAKHFLFYNCPETLDMLHGLLLVQTIWTLALITASSKVFKVSAVFRVNQRSHEVKCFRAFHVVFPMCLSMIKCSIHCVEGIFTLTKMDMDIDRQSWLTCCVL